MTLERKTIEYAFLALNTLLGAALLYFVLAPLPEFNPPAVRLADRPRHAAAAIPISVDPPSLIAEIEERPMFLPSRKPIANSAAAQAQLAPPDVALVGIILDGHDKLAMLRTPSAPFANSYRIGAAVGGWQVTEITADKVVLTAGGERDEVRLDSNRAASKPPGPPPPPAASQPPVQPASQ